MIANVELQRKRVGLTQTELSTRIGISRRALSSIEKSTAIPSVDIALKLANILNTTVENLFVLDDTKNEGVLTLPIVQPAIETENSNKWKEFRFIDLFAGIGGIRLGFESVGGKCVFSSEFDEDACKTYEANFGEHPSGDITKINAKDIPDFDILLGGFPCQSFSIIGKKNGGIDFAEANKTNNILLYSGLHFRLTEPCCSDAHPRLRRDGSGQTAPPDNRSAQ